MTTDAYDPIAFHDELVDRGLIISTGVKGAYARGAVLEDVLQRLDRIFADLAAQDGAETMQFPPVVARKLVEKLGYLDNFPQLSGSIHSFFGNDSKARELSAMVAKGEDWEMLLDPTEVMMMPAACYPVYPLFSGLLPAGGRLVTVLNWIFRHEPSDEPTRLVAFRMRELVCAGEPEQVVQWRDMWLERSMRLLGDEFLLPVQSTLANDPFFGRVGKMMAANQIDQRLKFEITCPVVSKEKPTAICSFNWHQDKFASAFGIQTADRKTASTACLGFGLERVTLALFKTHGLDPKAWPSQVRSKLW